MKKTMLLSFILIVCVLIERSFVLSLLGSWTPNTVLALSFAFIFNLNYEMAIQSAFIGGLFTDLLSLGIFGISTFLYTSVSLSSSLVKKYIFKSPLVQVVLMFLSYVFYNVISLWGVEEVDTTVLFGFTITLILSLVIRLFIKKLEQA